LTLLRRAQRDAQSARNLERRAHERGETPDWVTRVCRERVELHRTLVLQHVFMCDPWVRLEAVLAARYTDVHYLQSATQSKTLAAAHSVLPLPEKAWLLSDPHSTVAQVVDGELGEQWLAEGANHPWNAQRRDLLRAARGVVEARFGPQLAPPEPDRWRLVTELSADWSGNAHELVSAAACL